MKSERPSKEFILAEIRRTAEANGGEVLGQGKFVECTGIAKAAWLGHYWARWSDAVIEAGLTPQTFQSKVHTDDDLVAILTTLTRHFGKLPAALDLRLYRKNHDASLPNDKVFERLGSAPERRRKVFEYARSNNDYADVAALLAEQVQAESATKTTAKDAPSRVTTGAVYMLRMGEFYKVGKTNDAGRRLYEIGLQLPEKHDVVHVIETDDPSGIEAYWHRRFAAQRANGEWFRLADGDIAAFQRREYM